MSAWEAIGKSDEWYTPKYIFDALGCRFDLDPAGAVRGGYVPASVSYFGGGGLEVEQNTPLAAMADTLGNYGQKVRPVDLGSKVNGAQLTAAGWTGASDPRSEGTSATIDAKGKVTVTKPRASDEAPSEDVG